MLVSYYDPDSASARTAPDSSPTPGTTGAVGDAESLEALGAPGWLEGSGMYNFTRVSASMLTFVAPALEDTAADASSRAPPFISSRHGHHHASLQSR